MARLAGAAGHVAQRRFYPELAREERRSLALHTAIAARLAEDPDTVLDRARVVLRRMRAAQPGARALLDEWEALLKRPRPAQLPVLLDLDPRSRELRHVTPFAGVLSAAERARTYREFAQSERVASSSEATARDGRQT